MQVWYLPHYDPALADASCLLRCAATLSQTWRHCTILGVNDIMAIHSPAFRPTVRPSRVMPHCVTCWVLLWRSVALNSHISSNNAGARACGGDEGGRNEGLEWRQNSGGMNLTLAHR